MIDNYTTTKFDKERHVEPIAHLQLHLWGGDVAANKAYFRWKYLDNPYCDEPVISIAEKDGDVVGMRGALGAVWQIGPAYEPAFCLGDTVVSPGHRKGSNLLGA